MLTTVISAERVLLGPPYPSLDKIGLFFFTYDVINSYVHFKMFRYKSKANYQPNGGCYLQILSGKDLYKQTIVISSKDGAAVLPWALRTHTFPVRFPNIFVDYLLGQMRVGDKLWHTGIKLLCDYGKLS